MNSFNNRLGLAICLGLGLLIVGISGCTNPRPSAPAAADATPYTSDLIKEGDIIQIVFPGATNLNKVVKVPLEGSITLDFAGKFIVAGRSPKQVQDEILRTYGPQLSMKEVTVTLVTSAAHVYVSGAVLRPGKIAMDRPMTAMEAIMEAGGFDNARARPGKVKIIRQEEGVQRTFEIDLKKTLDGTETSPFYLQPLDIVDVPLKTFNL